MQPVTCFCCCPPARRGSVSEAVHTLYPHAACIFADSAAELRETLIGQDGRTCIALAGYSESGVSDINLCAAIARDGCAHEVVLAVDSASGSLRSRAKRAGISRILEPEKIQSHPVRETEEHTMQVEMRRTEPARDGSDGRAPLVVLCSGRGGVGKTSLTATAALIAASWGLHVGLIDLDLANGNLYTCFGLKRGADLASLAAPDPEAIASLSLSVGDSIELWGPCSLPELAEKAAPFADALIDCARSNADLVLADTASTTTDAVAGALQRADRVVLVYDGRQASLAALARLGGLAVRLGVARTRIMRLENHADPYAKPDYSYARAEMGLEVARPLRVFEGGPEVAQLMGEGLAGELARYSCDFTRSVASCLAQILAELGCLPDCEAARRASREPSVKRRFWRFSRGREVG